MKDGAHSLHGIRTDSLGEEAQQGHSSSVRTRAPHSLHTPENSPAPAGHGSLTGQKSSPTHLPPVNSCLVGEERGGEREGGLTHCPAPRAPRSSCRASYTALPSGWLSLSCDVTDPGLRQFYGSLPSQEVASWNREAQLRRWEVRGPALPRQPEYRRCALPHYRNYFSKRGWENQLQVIWVDRRTAPPQRGPQRARSPQLGSSTPRPRVSGLLVEMESCV